MNVLAMPRGWQMSFGFMMLARSATASFLPPMTNRPTTKKTLTEEQRFQYLISGISDYAIYMLDPEGHVSSWNTGAQRFKGYRAPEILGQHFSRFYTPEDRAGKLPERALAWHRAARRSARIGRENENPL